MVSSGFKHIILRIVIFKMLIFSTIGYNTTRKFFEIINLSDENNVNTTHNASNFNLCENTVTQFNSNINNLFLDNTSPLCKSCDYIIRTQEWKTSYVVSEKFCLLKCNRCTGSEIVSKICNEFLHLSNNFPSQEISIKINTSLIDYLTSESASSLIEFATTKFTDPSWKSRLSVNHLVSLTISRNRKMLKELPHPIHIFFKYKLESKFTSTKGFASKKVFRGRTSNMEEWISVYKLNTSRIIGSITGFVKFYYLNIYEEFMVSLTKDAWPVYDDLILVGKKISMHKISFKFKLENLTQEDIYYLGILPVSPETHLPLGQIEYTFEVRYFQCLFKHADEWSSEGCSVGKETTDETLHCQCHHLSLFGGNVGIAPQDLDLVSDIHLVVDIKDNPRTTLLVSSLILTYLIMLVWTRHSDRKDCLQRNVVVLKDNFPGEAWPYLVTVFTGLWIGSGTDAEVALRLYGTRGMSRVHILESRERKVLKQNCDDWFLICTPKSLGEIEKIHLFHDHCGRSHDWYCTKILVYDLKEEQDYKFVIEKWLSLKEVDECVELYAYPTSTLKYLKRTRIIRENIIFGLRETHLLLSIFTRHPRTSVTRSQRLSICLCIVFMHLLTSIMFFQVGDLTTSPGFSSSRRQLIISMESTFLATPFTFIVIFCFKMSRMKVVRKGENVPMTLTAKMPVPLESGLHANQSSMQRQWVSTTESDVSTMVSESTLGREEEETDHESEVGGFWNGVYEQLYRLLFQVLLVKPMMPVCITEEDDETALVRKKWMFAAWFLCLTAIFAGGVFIMLYNLKMDLATSNEWMNTSFKYSLGSIFIVSPVKIIMFAVILAMLYGQLQYIPSYECNMDAALNKESVGDEKYLNNILKSRRRNCYRPLKHMENMVIRIKKSEWRQWRLVINFSVVVLLYAVLTFEVLSHWEGLYLPTSANILKMFEEGRNITSLLSFYEYLSTLAVPVLNRKEWFNGQPTVPHGIWKREMGYTRDYITRLMSRPFLRQQRAPPDSCWVSRLMSDRFSQCYSPLLPFTKGDEEGFNTNWTLPQPSAESSNSPWIFSMSNSPLFICGYSTGKCYLPGGYINRLHYNTTLSQESLMNLQLSGWLDEATRFVVLELVMYNANTDLMSYVTPMLEKLSDGSLQFHVKTTNLHSRPINYTTKLIIVLSFTFYYFCRTVLLFNRQGLAYLFSLIGLLDIFLNILLHITMISMTLYVEARKSYVNDWYESNKEDLIMKTDIFVHRAVLRYETAILVIIIPAQVLKNFYLGKSIQTVFKTLSFYLKFTFAFALAWLIFYEAALQICIINRKNPEFFSLNNTFGWRSYGSFNRMAFAFFSLFFNFVSNFVSIFTIVISVKCFRGAKENLKYDYNFNMIRFIFRKLKRVRKKLGTLGKKLGKYKMRMRAGADVMDVVPTNRSCQDIHQMCKELSFKCDMMLGKLMEIEKHFDL